MTKKTSLKPSTCDILSDDTAEAQAENELDRLIYEELRSSIDDLKRTNNHISKEIMKVNISIASLDKRVAIIEKLSTLHESHSELTELRLAIESLGKDMSDKKPDKYSTPSRLKLNSIEWDKIGRGIGWIILATGAALTGLKAALEAFKP
jgi:uncharacterized protein YeeX (DUF496 family)